MPAHAAALRFVTRVLPVVALALSATAYSQSDYPTRPVRIIVPFGAGGLSDNLTRLFAKELSERLGQPFVPDFKPGASTNIGAAALATSAPDGHTLFVATIASNALNKWTYKKLPYDPDGFVNVGMLAVNTFYVVVRPESPFQSVQDLVRTGRESPKGLSYGSHGNGGANHMITELFRTKAGIKDLLHVAYKGPESHIDLMAGRTDFMIDGAAVNLVQSGKLRALAVAFPKRWPTQPNVPTMAEAGFPDVTISTFFGLSAPAGTPAPIADKLNAALRAIASQPEMDKRLLAMNMMPMPMARQEMNDFIRAQSDKWGPVLRSLNIVFE
ncbi:MAG: Bug family tripartite tricarboxylate transporter substrate binding protein [Burkholderiales bacterium]